MKLQTMRRRRRALRQRLSSTPALHYTADATADSACSLESIFAPSAPLAHPFLQQKLLLPVSAACACCLCLLPCSIRCLCLLPCSIRCLCLLPVSAALLDPLPVLAPLTGDTG